MRIAALHLMAYGHFSNKSLQFGKAPGFHLVYGDNEAGKSTALRALSSVHTAKDDQGRALGISGVSGPLNYFTFAGRWGFDF